MAFDPQDRQEIRLYLLGRLEPDERSQRVEERMLTERDYYEELLVIEDEVIDEYLAGALSPPERAGFEECFLSTPERHRKLRFARAFGSYVASDRQTDADPSHAASPAPEAAPAPAHVSAPAPARVAPPGRLAAFFRPLFSRPVAAAAAAVVLAAFSLFAWRAYVSRDAKVEEGLAALREAYGHRRPVESRIAGWSYAPWSVTRGGADDAASPASIQLARAERLLLDAVHERPGAASRHALGRLYLAQKKFDRAVPLFEEALRDDEGNARLHNDLGVALLEQARAEPADDGGSERSIEALARSVEHFKRSAELDDSLAEAHFNRALAYQQMTLWRQAEESWREYLRRDPNSPWADEARRNLKLLEEGRGAAAHSAEDDLAQFVAAARSGDDAAAWKVVGRNYTSAGNGVANSLLDAHLGLTAAGHPNVEPAAALQALTHLARLERDRAGDRYTTDLAARHAAATPQERALLAGARASARAGYELFTRSRWPEAIAEYEKARLAYVRAGDGAGRLFVEYRLAHCHVFLPDLTKARAAFERLAEAGERAEYRWLAAISLYGLAHVSINRSEFSRAADYSGRALSAFERHGDLNGVLRCLVQLADVNRELSQTRRSLGYLRRGLVLTGEGPAEPMQRWGLLVQVAFSLSSARMYAAALFYQKEALGVALDIGRPLLVSRSHGYVGAAYAAVKMYAEALDSAARAYEVGGGLPAGVREEMMANASQQFGDIFRQAGDCGKALEAYDRSIRLYDELNVEYYMYAAHKGKFLCHLSASDDRAAGEELRTVLDLFERYREKITAESHQHSFFDNQQAVYDTAIRYGLERMGDPARAFEYAEMSRARSLLAEVRRGGEMRGVEGGGPAPNLSGVPGPMTLAEIQAGLPPAAQVLQYAVLEDRTLVWVVSASGVRFEQVGVGSEQLAERVRAYLSAASAPPPADDAEQARRAEDLYRLLVAPAEPFLDPSKFLCVVPDKALHYLPFGALVSPATGRYLIEDYDLGLAPSASTFVAVSARAAARASVARESLLSVGEPSFTRAAFPSLPDLPSAAREARSVADFYDERHVLLRRDAGEQSVKAELRRADVAHFATHYVVNESSELLSGFPLAPEPGRSAAREDGDGFLQSHEIYRMRLPRTRLVVLSACRTGIEKQYGGEGAVGVARQFLVAGVPAVVASLWPVDTDASAELMVNFHRHRRRSALPVSRALRRAQIEMARGPEARFRHPYYWAPFVAIGGHTTF